MPTSAIVETPSRILVVCLRRLGDVLLSTALIRSLRLAWPSAHLEVLVFADTAAMLAGNPDLDGVIALPPRGRQWRRSLLPMFRRYDLALALQTSDRAHLVARWCGRHCAGLLPPRGEPGRVWKRLLIGITVTPRGEQHVVSRYLALADALGLPHATALVAPRPPATETRSDALTRVLGADWNRGRYAVVHPLPLYRYKAWHDQGWRETIRWLVAQGLRVCVTGGPADAEKARVASLLAEVGELPGVVNLCGRLSLAELTPLLESAQAFVGPDTSVTHLAAASGAPTLALFGPSDPVVWGPWPVNFNGSAQSPWRRSAAMQQRGNVTILQGTQGRFGDCIPCLQEGCERNLGSPSDCLDHLSAARVLAALEMLMDPPRRAGDGTIAAGTSTG